MSRRVYEVTVRVTEYSEKTLKGNTGYREQNVTTEEAREIGVVDIKGDSAETILGQLSTIIPAL